MGAGWLPLESLVLLQDAQAERGQVPCPFYLCLANHDAPEDIRGPQTPCDQQRGCPQGQTTEASGRVALSSLCPLMRRLALAGAHPGSCSPATRSPSPPPRLSTEGETPGTGGAEIRVQILCVAKEGEPEWPAGQ